MKKLVGVCCIFCLLFTLILGQAALAEVPKTILETPPVFVPFAELGFGTSHDDFLKAQTTVPDVNDPTTIGFLGVDVFGLKGVEVYYMFNEGNMLYDIVCTLRPTLDDPTDAILLYNEMVAALTAAYGEPLGSSVTWGDPTYQNEPDKLGLALQLGHVYYLSAWSTETYSAIVTLFCLSDQSVSLSFDLTDTALASNSGS